MFWAEKTATGVFTDGRSNKTKRHGWCSTRSNKSVSYTESQQVQVQTAHAAWMLNPYSVLL